MKILLVQPNIDTCYEYASTLGVRNLFLLCKDSHDAEFYDASTDSYNHAIKKILKKEYDIIGISAQFTNAIPYCIDYAKEIKKHYPSTIIIGGGNHATMAPEDLLNNNFDYVVRGEGELTFLELLNALDNKKDCAQVNGIAFLQNGQIRQTPPREIIQDLDSLPVIHPDGFDDVRINNFAGIKYLNIETSRGCPYNCSFCTTSIMWGHQYRYKSAERVLLEFKLAKEHHVNFIWLVDDDTALNEERLREMCSLLIKENAQVPWATTINCISIKQPSTYKLMRESGCIKINICLESANERILREYRKPFKLRDVINCYNQLHENNILVHNHGIIGLPGEKCVETLRTYYYLMRNSDMWHVTILEPRPGNDYWDNWDGKHNISEYMKFGKANIILNYRKFFYYSIYRFFCVIYFFNPFRIYKALFLKPAVIRYNYWIQYFVAYKILQANFRRVIKTKFRALRINSSKMSGQ